jgi:Flp pilus assembly CpaE family ATPase
LHAGAVRRIAVLSRVLFGATVLALESRLEAEESEAMRLSDLVVLVVRPDVLSLGRAQRALAAAGELGLPRDRFRLVVNRWGQPGQLPRKAIEEALGLSVHARIQDAAAKVNKALNRGTLLAELAPRASISKSFSKLAATLNGMK